MIFHKKNCFLQEAVFELQFRKHLFVTLAVEEETKRKGEQFSTGEAPPDGLDVAGEAGDEPGDRQEDQQLTAD